MKTLRYGTSLRCFDNGGRSADRYTILPPRGAKKGYRIRGNLWHAISADACPYSPQGIGMSVVAVPGPHLGRRIHWDELPGEVQRFARQTFPDFAPRKS